MGAFLLNYIQKIICKYYLEKIVGVSVSEDFRGILILHTLYAFCMGTWIYFIKKKDDSIEYKNIIGCSKGGNLYDKFYTRYIY